MKIFIFHNKLASGGSGTSLKITMEVLKQLGHQLYLQSNGIGREDGHCQLVSKYAENVYFRNIGEFHAYYYKTSGLRLIRNTGFFLLALPWLVRNIKKANPDVIYINTTVMAHILLLKFILPRTIKFIMHVREAVDNDSMLGKLTFSLINKFCDGIIFISEGVQPDKYTIKKDRSMVLYNPSQYVYDNPNDARSYVFNKNNPLKIVMMGQFYPSKGASLLLEALTYLAKDLNIANQRHIKLSILGIEQKNAHNSFYYDHFYNKLSELDTNDFIHCQAHAWTDPLPFLQEAHLLIRPSIACDPWGRDILEGMSLGCIPLATGLISPFIIDGVNGYLVKKANPIDIATAISKIYDTSQSNLIIIKEKTIHFSRKFSKEQYQTNLCNFLSKLH